MSLDSQQVPPQAAVPVIHVKYKGRRYRAPQCENSSSVQRWVCEKFKLATAELEYEDDGAWVVFDSDVDKDGGLQARTSWLLQVLEKEPAEKKMRVEGGCEAPPSVQIPEVCTKYLGITLFARESALKRVREYLNNVQKETPIQMLGCSGIKGIGKTALLVHIATTTAPSVDNVKGLYMTFNGGLGLTSTFHLARTKSSSGNLADAFAAALLVRCGLKPEDAYNASFQQTYPWLRQVLSCGPNDTLLICVDEIGGLQQCRSDNWPVDTMSALMREVDRFKGQLLFIFSHIEDSVLTRGASGSGREVLALKLPALPPDVWKKMEALDQWRHAASQHAAIHQLLLACCGHPRCLVDGLPAALHERPCLLTNPNEAALIEARNAIMRTCKFNDVTNDYMRGMVYRWFNHYEQDKMDLGEMDAKGLLLLLPDGTKLLNPLMLQFWAKNIKFQVPNAMQFHLSQIYDADAVLGPNTEKRMEALMFHYEAVLRVALAGEPFSLTDFYRGGYVDSTLSTKVTAILPSVGNIVMNVDNFQGKEQVLGLLRQGWIVVSTDTSEPGVEFLSPYKEHGSDKLLVAAVQCKFVQDKAAWGDISQKLQDAINMLESEAVQFFPVVYATPDQESIQTKTYKGGVYFTESGIFEFTNRLGILRLHVMKLGAALRLQHPWLEGSQVKGMQVQQM
eukprot:CAMPEP_0206482286 /NCGR_PEP_ID=MMETSP0324_2-20121206/38801_1 /ASSEMBLY_ACC=CAM_ASM_000836 /TAXON_ID=2866 /ORGANISM="Crypthecodinium cohnii, Strain Seligo" /LENGTH=677 /DNA_ID=CAMNT_0053960239 /DNA_START=158 /DNA_END=2191 /DNA_ORIENTATION=+